MLTVSYNSIHTPYQQAPMSLSTLPGARDDPLREPSPTTASSPINMLNSMDREIGRLLASLNLATLDENGTIQTVVDDNGYTQIPELQASNTMVVVVGDNGSFFEVTKLPFDPRRSKGTVYQTGVWVPLIVAGPLVEGPTGREVKALINVADLFDLFAEVAGINVGDGRAAGPHARQPTDARLSDQSEPGADSPVQLHPARTGRLRFEGEHRIAGGPRRSWPCVFALGGLGSQCNDVIADTQSFCHTNGGVWWGPADNPDSEVVAVLGEEAAMQGEPSCCAVIAAVNAAGMTRTIAVPDRTSSPCATRPTSSCSALSRLHERRRQLPARQPHVRRSSFYDLTPTGVASNPLGLDVQGSSLLCDVRGDGQPATCPDGSACDTATPHLLPHQSTSVQR